jgi:Flp pilus assembly protein TadB
MDSYYDGPKQRLRKAQLEASKARARVTKLETTLLLVRTALEAGAPVPAVLDILRKADEAPAPPPLEIIRINRDEEDGKP